MRVLVTGASGFVGKALCKELANRGFDIVAVARTRDAGLSEIASKLVMADLADINDEIQSTLLQVDVLIHVAGRAHIIKEQSKNPYLAYAKINIEATKNLALQAASCGVKRFIYISSVKVNGETTNTVPFDELITPSPEDDYGKTKYEAEKELRLIAANANMEVVIIRPPLIYGKGVKANLKNLIKLCQSKLLLPFGAIHNKRSMVYIENLIDFIALCITHPKAANETFLISDDEDVSTTTLIRTIRTTLGLPSLLLPIPRSWMVFMLCLIGRKSLLTRLCGNLQVDITKAKTLLGWKPPFTFEQGIKNTIQEK